MLKETANVAKIELINTENYLNKDGYYEIDFCPDREFKGEVYMFFYIKESWGNVHWYKMFKHYDSKNIKVICYASFNFLPLAKNLCHKIYLEKTPIVNGFYNVAAPKHVSDYGMNRHRFWHTYDLGKKGGYVQALPHEHNWLMTDQEGWGIGNQNKNNHILIDQREFDNFMKQKHDFGESKVLVESKLKHNNHLRHKLSAKENVHADHSFQRKILSQYTKFSYATYQILLSMYCGFTFVGIRGAASLLSMMPVNLLIATDLYNSNCTSFSIRYHDAINDYYYRTPTGGFPHEGDAPRQLEGTWREQAINFAIDEWLGRDIHYVPTKNISHFESLNPKLRFLIDKSS